jgi:ribosome-associated heat shock protein Hsp15
LTDAIQRLDKWLWCARFFKSRSGAAKFCDDGRLRVSGQVTHKAHYSVKPGDVLTFPLGPHIRVVRIVSLAGRRGPPAEARSLYEDLAPPEPPEPRAPAIRRDPGQGRPTKADRRAIDRLREGVDGPMEEEDDQ